MRTFKIICYVGAAILVIATAVAIAILSVVVAPSGATEDWSGLAIVSLGGLAIAGGIVYLGEKLINLSIGVAKVVSEIIIEKFKKAERAAGRAEGRVELHRMDGLV